MAKRNGKYPNQKPENEIKSEIGFASQKGLEKEIGKFLRGNCWGCVRARLIKKRWLALQKELEARIEELECLLKHPSINCPCKKCKEATAFQASGGGSRIGERD